MPQYNPGEKEWIDKLFIGPTNAIAVVLCGGLKVIQLQPVDIGSQEPSRKKPLKLRVVSGFHSHMASWISGPLTAIFL